MPQLVSVAATAKKLLSAWATLPRAHAISVAGNGGLLRHPITSAARHATRARIQEIERATQTRIDTESQDGEMVCIITGSGDLRAVAAKIDEALEKAMSELTLYCNEV